MSHLFIKRALAAMAVLVGAHGYAAEIVKVAPAALTSHLKSHDKVVVYFTSTDPKCGFCVGNADQLIGQVAAKLDNDISFVRVEWAPWSQFPPEARFLGVTGIPDTRVYKAGVEIHEVSGKVTDPALLAAGVRNAFLRAVDLVAIPRVAPAALSAYLRAHDKVVVYFTSPDSGCGFCGGPADRLVAQLPPLLDRDVTLIRVEWTPWGQPPPELTAFAVNSLPSTKVFKSGVEVYGVGGRVTDPVRLAGDVRTALKKTVAAASAAGTQTESGGPPSTAMAPVSIASTGAVRPVNPAQFGWDLSYRPVLTNDKIGKGEFVRFWLGSNPTRPVSTKFASYAGDPIIASLLIDKPDAHAGDPQAMWIVRTQREAGVCNFHPKFMNLPCLPLEPERADAFMREMLAMKMPPPQVGPGFPRVARLLPDGSPMLLTYIGFMSVWVDGRSLQRPILVEELAEGETDRPAPSATVYGQLAAAMKKLMPPEPAAPPR